MSLSDRDLKAYFDRIGFAGDPRPERRRLESPAEVCAVLENEFGIGIPDRKALIVRLEALG